jgi:hypothetical protein
MSSTTVTCRKIWYNITATWDEVNQVPVLDPSTPVIDYASLCALTIDGNVYSDNGAVGVNAGQVSPGFMPTQVSQFTFAQTIFYDPSNEASVQAELSGLVNLVTHTYTVEYGV